MELNVEEIIKTFNLELLSIKAAKENEMRKEQKFCDLTLKINDKDLFKVHKTIIASSCPYFFGMLNGDWKESKENVISLDYKINSECFENILDYIYTGKFGLKKISLENAKIIHEGSVFFHLPPLKEIMSKILEKFITNENLLEMWRHGVKNFDDSLNENCVTNISKNYIQFFNRHLLELTFTELKNLFENQNLNCEQVVIYENLIKWIKADFETREKYLKDLLNFVDFSKIPGEFMQSKIINDKNLYKNEYFIEKIMQELSNSKNIKLRTIVNGTRNKFEKLDILLISNTGIFKIDLEAKKCLPLLKHKVNREEFAVINFGFNNILISGGLNSNTCENYCPDLNLIREFPPMLEKRRNHRILALDNKIYAFGGYEKDTMEIFDIFSGKWSYGPKMLSTSTNTIWASYSDVTYFRMGSFTDNLIDMYDIAQNKWSTKNANDETLKYVFAKHYHFTSSAYYAIKNNIRGSPQYYFNENNKFSSYGIKNTQDNNTFIFGKKLNSDEFLSALLDRNTGILTPIKIDLSECGDIGHYFQLTTAYL